ENLRIDPRSFEFNSDTQQVKLDDTTPPPVASWLRFSSPTFTIHPGEWFTERITVSLPKEAGFSYSFALVVKRAADQAPPQGNRALKGSVAIFTLINVDRPDATRRLELSKFTTSKDIYEYLPVELNVQLKNTGNTIAQPVGTVFVQRGEH